MSENVANRCPRCSVELVDGVAGEYEADEPHLDHTDARCADRLRETLEHVLMERLVMHNAPLMKRAKDAEARVAALGAALGDAARSLDTLANASPRNGLEDRIDMRSYAASRARAANEALAALAAPPAALPGKGTT